MYQVHCKVRSGRDKDSSSFAQLRGLVCCFGCTRSTDRVFTSCAEAGHTAGHDHHPEHTMYSMSESWGLFTRSFLGGSIILPQLRRPVGSGCKDDTQNQEERCRNHARSTTDTVDQGAEEEHTKDLTDEVRVGQACRGA